MNGNWEGLINITGMAMPLPDSTPLLAQSPFDDVLSVLGANLGTSLIDLVRAILILLVGWIVAGLVSKFIKGVLNRTSIDNKITSWITGGQGGESLPVEDWIANTVYWLIMLFVIVAFLQALKLDAVSEPLNALLEQVTVFLPKIGGAALLLGVAWILATVVKMIITRVLGAFRLDQRLGSDVGGSDFSLTQTLGNGLYWFIFLLFLPSILGILGLEGTLAPVQTLLDEILSVLPNILGAVLIGAVGWFVAQIVRRVVTNLLAATGVNQLGERFGLSSAAGGQSLAQIIGTIVYVLVLIPAAIFALDNLEIEAISEPAIAMLNQVLNFLPKIFSASVIIAVAYFAGKFVAELVTNILTGLGFDNIAETLGLPSPTATEEAEAPRPETGQATVLQPSTQLPSKTPSELVGTVVLIAIVLVGALSAIDILQIQALENVLSVILTIAGQVLLGLIVLAIGLFLANFAYKLISSSGGSQANFLGQAARIAIIALVSAMALQQMGIATDIVNLAFGLLLGAIAVAIALAFGLGGRDIAAEQVREWLAAFKKGE